MLFHQKLPPATQRLTGLYWGTIVSVAITSLIGYILLDRSLANQAKDIHLVNLAARQRSHSLALSKAALAFEVARSQDLQQRQEELQQAITVWEQSYQELQQGSLNRNLTLHYRSEVSRLLAQIEPYHQSMIRAASNLLQRPRHESSINLDTIQTNTTALVLGMDTIVWQYEQQAQGYLKRLRRIAIIVLAIAPTLAAVAIALIFHNLRYQLGTRLTSLKQSQTQIQKLEGELKRKNVTLDLALQEAQSAIRLKAEFLTSISHEMRTPMNGVMGMTGLLLDTELDEEQLEYVETIRQCSDSLLTLISRILDYSKIEAGRLELDTHPFHLHDCIEDALDLVLPQAAEKNLNLVYLVDPATPTTLIGDINRLRQILVNLLSNAVKFTTQGEVSLLVSSAPLRLGTGELHPNRHEIRFIVKDTGIGIPLESQHRLFQLFSQVDGSTTRSFGGTGLGLVVSRRLCELMGGQMWVESKEGEGSTFHFTILTDATPAPSRAWERLTPSLEGKQVLVVNRYPLNRQVMLQLLHRWGINAIAMEKISEAQEWLQQGHSCDWAIVDTTSSAFNESVWDKLPLVMLGPVGPSSCEPPPRFVACLSKPIKPIQLYEIVLYVSQLPVLEPARTGEKTPLSHPDKEFATTYPFHILLAEDNVVSQKVALRVLQRLGYRAEVVANGLEVLEALHRQAYDVVLMDIQMSEMDGVTCTHHIRQLAQSAAGLFEVKPWVIGMTAGARAEDRQKCIEQGMDDAISKPVRLEALQEALKRCSLATQAPEQGANGKNDLNLNLVVSRDADRVDFKLLEQLSQELQIAGEPDVMVELIEEFLRTTPLELEKMWEAFQSQDQMSLALAAHNIKGSCRTFGLRRMVNLCFALEEQVKTEMFEEVKEGLMQLEVEFEQVRKLLQARC